ncbi:ABC transporter permease [Rufibacter quisquiliarum]|uniref:Putative ABC transport system permease protein n=1 Tax=Rufibacter quisquiliarum TaxID=1549639 RepID=A0A839GGJ3_9BACT|nr:ABC transporter permease [Rufibacter quisquiliarum]MBA9075769.1 putative ABC transport system permease protein [Rufibacter quisquiliarum]
MIDIDKWSEIYATVKKHKLRTGLTAFGVFWGIFMLVLLLGAGKGLENGVMKDFNVAKNAIFVWTQRTSVPYMGMQPGRYIYLTNEDTEAIRNQIPEVGIISPSSQLWGTFTVSRLDKNSSFTVNGEYPELPYVEPLTIARGRFLNKLDIEEKRKICIIGPRAQEVLFKKDEDPLGKYINIKGSHFQVVGIFQPVGKGEDIVQSAQTIYIPHSTLQQTFNQQNRVGHYKLIPAPGVASVVVEDKVKALLAQRHQVAPTDLKAFGSANVEKEFEEVQGLFAGIAGFSWLVSIGTIIAGVIGVGNIMLIVVKERTKEIGIRKALGATPWSVISLILQESVVITALAGYLGLLAGTGLIALIDYLMVKFNAEGAMFSNPEVDPKVGFMAVALLVVMGAIAGLIPATKAARVNPVVALKDE